MTRESISSREHSHITHNIYTLPALQIFIAARSFSSSYLRRVRGTSSNRDAPSVSVQCTQCLIESSCLFLSFFFFERTRVKKKKQKTSDRSVNLAQRKRERQFFFSLKYFSFFPADASIWKSCESFTFQNALIQPSATSLYFPLSACWAQWSSVFQPLEYCDIMSGVL